MAVNSSFVEYPDRPAEAKVASSSSPHEQRCPHGASGGGAFLESVQVHNVLLAPT
jgi:hypothetical protein